METQPQYHIRRVAVLGAGVMGAQIAAHFANAHIPVTLFELPSEGDDPRALARRAIAGLAALKPSPLSLPENASLMSPASYDHDLEQLRECDLVIEAIAERMDWKAQLYQRIADYLPTRAIIASNTSGLSINALAEHLPEALQPRFCGVHFFNPPRYMQLVELIPHKCTNVGLLTPLESFLTSRLGKGVVYAKDTPNFIANRVGVFAMLSIIRRADQYQIKPDIVDAITGPLIGRAKSATFRTADVVGLDTFGHVVNTMATTLADDPWHQTYALPGWVEALIQDGALGQKSGRGIYQKKGKDILVYDAASQGYRPSQKQHKSVLMDIFKEPKAVNQFRRLRETDHPEARFLLAHFMDIFHYCAYHLADIADNARDVDLALRWGFGWQAGPFELWHRFGWQTVLSELRQWIEDGKPLAPKAQLPKWVGHLNGKGIHNADGSYAPGAGAFRPRWHGGVYARQLFPNRLSGEPAPGSETLLENAGVRLWSVPTHPDVAILSFKTKMHTVSQDVLDGMQQALTHCEQQNQPMVLWQATPPFSAGANLAGVSDAIQANRWPEIEHIVESFQRASQRLQYSRIPVVAAANGLALGGGCEFLMHCDRVVAHLESYIGLVEVGVGLLPAGGGCKEFARRLGAQLDIINPVKAFGQLVELIGKGQVSTSADHAIQMGYLRPSDIVVMHPQETLMTAIETARHLHHANYRPPTEQPIRAAGRHVAATLKAQLVNWLEGGFISEHDALIAGHIADILTGGDVAGGTLVPEEWYITMERKAFLSLMQTEPTQARIVHMLNTGKPLRN